MTEAENERRKLKLRQSLYDGTRVEQRYPSVKSIEIVHERTHSSAFGSSHKDGVWSVSPGDHTAFVLECLNPECSSIGFNLRGIIEAAVRNRDTEVSGLLKCTGQEAPDHPEQSCNGLLKYIVRIVYQD